MIYHMIYIYADMLTCAEYYNYSDMNTIYNIPLGRRRKHEFSDTCVASIAEVGQPSVQPLRTVVLRVPVQRDKRSCDLHYSYVHTGMT
jgi:hypothetical protein